MSDNLAARRTARLGVRTLAAAGIAAFAGGAYRYQRTLVGAEQSIGRGPQLVSTRSYGGVRTAAAASADAATPVKVASVVRGTLVLPVNAAGQAVARRADLVGPSTGWVQSVAVRESDVVREGAVLVVLDTADQALAVTGAEAARRLAEVQYRDFTVLDDRVADSSVRRDRQAAARARSGIDVADAALARARLDLWRRQVRAPFAGLAADVVAVAGGWVGAGERLLSVVAPDPVRIAVLVLESDLGAIAVGGRAVITLPALPGEEFVGRVERINPAVDPETRAVRVTVRLPNAGGRILPGMYARVSMDGRALTDRVLVPRQAVLERDRRTLVFVYEASDGRATAKWRYVSLGAGNDRLVEVTDGDVGPGVRPGELVLVDGHTTLTHDAPVRLKLEVDPRAAPSQTSTGRAEP